MAVYRLGEEIVFPAPVLANEDGLLAVGGDLRVERLVLAYMYGIFPWYNPGSEIMWWCPKERFLIMPGEEHVSHSMKKYLRKHEVRFAVNRDFADTIHQCRVRREEEGTWITDEMEAAYKQLNEKGLAVSVESFADGELAGGLYGVAIGRCFFGESMYSRKENGSKAALIGLSRILKSQNFLFIDCQFHTDHLESMGGKYVCWETFDRMLEEGTGRGQIGYLTR